MTDARGFPAPDPTGDPLDGFVPFLDGVAAAWRSLEEETDRDTIVIYGLMDGLARALRAVQAEALAPFGLNHAEWTALGRLRTSPRGTRHSPTELRQLVGQTSAGMTRVLAKLETAGLVRREPHPNDGRGSNVVLTAKGRRVADQSFRAAHRRQSELLSGFTPSERDGVVDCLLALLRALVDGPVG